MRTVTFTSNLNYRNRGSSPSAEVENLLESDNPFVPPLSLEIDNVLKEGACCLERNFRNCSKSTEVGLDSILQKSISRKEKQANAL